MMLRGLRRGEAPARHRCGFKWKIEPPRDFAGQESGLVEAAPPQASPMQRHGNYQRRSRQPIPATRRQGTRPARGRPIDRGRTCDGESTRAGCRVRPRPWCDSARQCARFDIAADARGIGRIAAHRLPPSRASRRKLRSAAPVSARPARRIERIRAGRRTERRPARGASGRKQKVGHLGERGHI